MVISIAYLRITFQWNPSSIRVARHVSRFEYWLTKKEAGHGVKASVTVAVTVLGFGMMSEVLESLIVKSKYHCKYFFYVLL